MIRHASDEIRRSEAEERTRRRVHAAKRQQIDQLDQWTQAIEEILEADQVTVPKDLFRDIANFTHQQAPALYHNLRHVHDRNAVRVLDILFDVQEVVRVGGRRASRDE